VIKFIVHYEVNGIVYESEVNTATSGGAIQWVKSLFPHAINVYIVDK